MLQRLKFNEEDTYVPRRKVIVEKYSERIRFNQLEYIRKIKNIIVREQQYEKAAFLRDFERAIDLDYNVFEEYIYFLKEIKYLDIKYENFFKFKT